MDSVVLLSLLLALNGMGLREENRQVYGWVRVHPVEASGKFAGYVPKAKGVTSTTDLGYEVGHGTVRGGLNAQVMVLARVYVDDMWRRCMRR